MPAAVPRYSVVELLLLLKRHLSPLTFTGDRQGSLAPRALPRFLTTMGPADFRHRRRAVMNSRQASGPNPRCRISQVPRPTFRCAPSPITPAGPAAAYTRCLTTGDRLRRHPLLGHLQNCLTRPNRAHFRWAHIFALEGFDDGITPARRSLGYMSYGQFTWPPPFR
mgnify:CR=1 FL=1